MVDSSQDKVVPSNMQRPLPVNPHLDRKLFAYTTAATAAGVGMLALPQNSAAEVAYTPANQTITGSFALDLNHDGVTDFTINNTHSTFTSGLQFFFQSMNIKKPGRNLVLGTYGGKSFAQALPPHKKVGEGEYFRSYNSTARMNYCLATRTSWRYSGSWFNVEQRYLGFKFSIGGKIHYGWARLNVTVRGPKCTSSALLTGYAYETVPNRAIVTGKTSGAEESSEPEASDVTLGSLALGKVTPSTVEQK
jgi:hypothetical protein